MYKSDYSASLPKVLFVLYEHAAGYAIFRCRDVEDIGSLLPEVQAATADFALFSSMATLEAFSPFKSGANALENINAVSEGVAGLGGGGRRVEWLSLFLQVWSTRTSRPSSSTTCRRRRRGQRSHWE